MRFSFDYFMLQNKVLMSDLNIQSRHGFFCMSLLVRLLFSWTSGESQGWWFCNVAVIDVVVGGGKNGVYLLHHLDRRSTVDFFQPTIITTLQGIF